MTRAWMQTISGRAVAIATAAAGDIDPVYDMPEMLARITRYNGAVPGGVFSIAQHSCLVSDAILDEMTDPELAAIGLLHDGHEYIIGDITTPQALAIAEIEAELFGDSRFHAVMHETKRRLDKAIFAACGVPWPVTPKQERLIKAYDTRALATEKRHLLGPSVRPWASGIESAPPIRTRGRITCWSQFKAADEFRKRLVALCPAVAVRAREIRERT